MMGGRPGERQSPAPDGVNGTYRTIVADPPWHYDRKAWASITHGGTGPRIEKPMPYSTMNADDIAALPILALAADDCRLFLWTTSRHLPASFRVLSGWGFEYVQTLIWHKTGNPSPFSGAGIAPQHAEFLLVAKRGTPEILSRLKSSVIAVPKPIYGHSQKPDTFIDLIELASPGPYVELFARRARFGWDYWGDESLQTVELAGSSPNPEQDSAVHQAGPPSDATTLAPAKPSSPAPASPGEQ